MVKKQETKCLVLIILQLASAMACSFTCGLEKAYSQTLGQTQPPAKVREIQFWRGGPSNPLRDLDLTQFLAKVEPVNPVDFGFSADFEEKLRQGIERISLPSEANEPLILVLSSSMLLNAAYLRPVAGPGVLVINLGLLYAVRNDDELLFVAGHELEHGRSKLNERKVLEITETGNLRSSTNLKKAATLKLLDRSAETEVDINSVIYRVYSAGLNPTAGPTFLRRLLDDFEVRNSTLHSNHESRINAMNAALTVMKRLYGRRFDDGLASQVIVNERLARIFRSPRIIQKQEQSFQFKVQGMMASIEQLHKLFETPLAVLAKQNENESKKTAALAKSVREIFSGNPIRELLDEHFLRIKSEDEIIEQELKTYADLLAAIKSLRQQVLKVNPIEDVVRWQDNDILFPEVTTSASSQSTRQHPLLKLYQERIKIK